MNECAICYIGDRGFLFPMAASAIGIRRFVPSWKADIFIFLIEDDASAVKTLEAALRSCGIDIVKVKSSVFNGIDWARSNKTHVPLATLGRFFLDDMLPAACRRIIYLDGDTWVRRNPERLIDLNVPDGKFAAAEDISFFCHRDITPHGRFVRAYFKGLRIDGSAGYFNAGVFATQRNTWRILAREALEFFKNNIEACKYHDQSALNAVVGKRRLRLSLAWNFQTPFREWGIEKFINPAVYHFSRGPKPWSGRAEPWPEMFDLYEKEALELEFETAKTSIDEIEAANRRFHKQRRRLQYAYPIRLLMRRRRAKNLEKKVLI